ncbi:MAG TPA: serine--tRNA ligase [Sphingomonadaceae bacterium]
MHDLKSIRDNAAAFDAALARRGAGPAAAAILELDAKRREAATRMQEAQSRRNDASKLIGQAMAGGDKDKADALKAEVAELKHSLPGLEEHERDLSKQLDELLAALPNLPADDVPDGTDEAGNVEQAKWGTPREFDFAPKEHADLGPPLGLDFETAAKMSGARFTFLRGQMARLHRALGQFMLDLQTSRNGYTECAPPILVRDEAVFGTNQLPKFAEDLFRTTDGRWLIPTAEVSLTNSVREEIWPESQFPMRLTALTPCFRSEAGAAGKDTRGFIRQHQFDKVELVSVCLPDQWQAEHEHMLRSAESVLEALELPYRRMLLCAGDMGFGGRKTWDLEVWLPGQGAYREISSVSWCGDFQARRMNARYRPEGEKGTQFLHTLNGSGLAVGRTLVAVLENFQQADGSVELPAALHPYMGGITRLEPR